MDLFWSLTTGMVAGGLDQRVVPAGGLDFVQTLSAGGPVRALVAFFVVLIIGAGLLLWKGSLVDRATVTSTTRPLYSFVHGLAAHIVIVFGAVYAANQLGPLRVAGYSAATIGILAGILLLLAVGAFGLTVVGTILVEYLAARGPWDGLVVGAIFAAGIGVLPIKFGGPLWVLLVSMGIGGPVRRWFHAASEDDLP